MDWVLTISLAVNIVAFMVYIKIPEFLQQIFIKRLEHTYDIQLDTRSRNFEILPQLFYQVATAQSFYELNYTGNRLSTTDFREYAELKNFITRNQFFIKKSIREMAREIENEIFTYISLKHQSVTHPGGPGVENVAKQYEESSIKLQSLVNSLEQMIEKEMAD